MFLLYRCEIEKEVERVCERVVRETLSVSAAEEEGKQADYDMAQRGVHRKKGPSQEITRSVAAILDGCKW